VDAFKVRTKQSLSTQDAPERNIKQGTKRLFLANDGRLGHAEQSEITVQSKG
jgi:hypothetical protein